MQNRLLDGKIHKGKNDGYNNKETGTPCAGGQLGHDECGN